MGGKSSGILWIGRLELSCRRSNCKHLRFHHHGCQPQYVPYLVECRALIYFDNHIYRCLIVNSFTLLYFTLYSKSSNCFHGHWSPKFLAERLYHDHFLEVTIFDTTSTPFTVKWSQNQISRPTFHLLRNLKFSLLDDSCWACTNKKFTCSTWKLFLSFFPWRYLLDENDAWNISKSWKSWT